MLQSRVLQFALEKSLLLTGLTFSSNAVRPGFAFFAIKGTQADGNAFIGDAVERGAVLIISEQPPARDWPVPFLQSAGIDKDMADAAYEFYGKPSDQLNMIGITGTKGKTSIAYLTESIFNAAGKKSSVLGTVNYRINGNVVSSAPNTTPAALTLFNLLAQMRRENTDAAVMEVSSHALELQRVRHINFNTAVFTNLQRDHLDFHLNFENYFAAKQKLFENLLSEENHKDPKQAIINADDPYGRRLMEWLRPQLEVKTFAIDRAADYRAADIEEGLRYTLFSVNGVPARINLLGLHNVYNALAAYAVAMANGISPDVAIAGLLALKGVPGRMELIDEGQDFYVFVDFAYTDESLQRAYKTVANFKKTRVITVFGCGGERDRTKRPLMGKTACTHSDVVFLTNDNPRKEDPEQIFTDIIQGMKGCDNYKIIPDRADAIHAAIHIAQKDDIVIIAGKGHEQYQLVGAEKLPFSDQQTARYALREKAGYV